jgi:hypothetical protein
MSLVLSAAPRGVFSISRFSSLRSFGDSVSEVARCSSSGCAAPSKTRLTKSFTIAPTTCCRDRSAV